MVSATCCSSVPGTLIEEEDQLASALFLRLATTLLLSLSSKTTSPIGMLETLQVVMSFQACFFEKGNLLFIWNVRSSNSSNVFYSRSSKFLRWYLLDLTSSYKKKRNKIVLSVACYNKTFLIITIPVLNPFMRSSTFFIFLTTPFKKLSWGSFRFRHLQLAHYNTMKTEW